MKNILYAFMYLLHNQTNSYVKRNHAHQHPQHPGFVKPVYRHNFVLSQVIGQEKTLISIKLKQ